MDLKRTIWESTRLWRKGSAFRLPSAVAIAGRACLALGGCPMDGRDGEKVVDHLGHVHGHKNLYVADGAIVPTAVGVNPAFTISALAERIAENIRGK